MVFGLNCTDKGRFEKRVNLRKFDKHVTDVQINAIGQGKEEA